MISKGATVTDFTLPDQDDNPRRLGEFLATGHVALFFYPAAMTKGCTAQSCHFRDLMAEFRELDAHRVGISADAPRKQKQFAHTNDFDFPLLSDPDRKIARRFGAFRKLMPGPLATKRATFVIGTDWRVLDVIANEFSMTIHADQALETLRAHTQGGTGR